MAYGEKYRLTFDDIHKTDSVVWEVKFLFKDFTGDLTELTGSGTPLVITRGEDGQDKMAPIVGSKAEIEIMITDDKFDKEQFFTEQFNIKIEVYRASVIWWSGFVKSDYCEFPYAPTPYPFKIIATDGIALLKNNLVDLISVREDTGYVSLLNLIMEKGVFLTGHGLDELRVISSLTRTDSTQTFKSILTRYELWQDENEAWMNVYDILTQIATSFTGRIFFDQGYVWFQRIGDLWNANPTVLQYSTYDTAPEEVTLDSNFFKILKGELSSAEMIYVNNDSFITMMAAYKQSQIDLDYKFRTWLQNGDWHDFDSTDGFAHWMKKVDWGMVIDQHGTGTTDDPYTLFFQKDSSHTEMLSQYIENIPNNSSVRIQTKVKFFQTDRTYMRFYLTRKEADDTYTFIAGYNATSGQWYYNDNQDPYDIDDYKYWVKRSNKETPETTVDITLPKFSLPFNFQYLGFTDEIPANYQDGDNIVFEIDIVDPDGSISETVDYTGMEVSEIKLAFVENGYTGETYTNRTGKDYSKYNAVENFALIDAISSNVANKMDYDGDSDIQTWTADDVPLAISNFQAMALYSTMNVYSAPFQIMTGTYYSNKVKFFNTIQQAFGDFRLFMQLYDQYDVKRCQHTMTLAELKQTTGIADGSSSIRKFKTN